MLKFGCLMLLAGFVTLIAGYACWPLGLLGIAAMGIGWRALLIAGTK